jgi:hypothetical protein
MTTKLKLIQILLVLVLAVTIIRLPGYTQTPQPDQSLVRLPVYPCNDTHWFRHC